MSGKTSDAQKKASRAWEARNPEKAKVDRYRRTARLFIRNYATESDMEEFRAIFDAKENKN